MVSRTLSWVAGRTSGLPCSTSETVDFDTPAACATSMIVTRLRPPDSIFFSPSADRPSICRDRFSERSKFRALSIRGRPRVKGETLPLRHEGINYYKSTFYMKDGHSNVPGRRPCYRRFLEDPA